MINGNTRGGCRRPPSPASQFCHRTDPRDQLYRVTIRGGGWLGVECQAWRHPGGVSWSSRISPVPSRPSSLTYRPGRGPDRRPEQAAKAADPAQCRHLSGGSTMQTFWTTPSGVYWPERISRLDLNIVTDDNDNEAQRAAAGVSTVTVKVGRVYDQATDQDGNRVLVDRLWPRGMRCANGTAMTRSGSLSSVAATGSSSPPGSTQRLWLICVSWRQTER